MMMKLSEVITLFFKEKVSHSPFVYTKALGENWGIGDTPL